jgi:16S rRNA G527 N7-methylase RsmG
MKLDRLLDYALPLLSRPGKIVALKGAPVKAEVERVKGRIQAEGLSVRTETYRLPRLGHRRSLVILEKP